MSAKQKNVSGKTVQARGSAPRFLRESIEKRGVYYTLNKGRVQITAQDKALVETAPGRFGHLPVDGFSLVAMGSLREFGKSQVFHPEIKEHAEKIKLIDRWIEDNPARAKKNGVSKVDLTVSTPPVDTWNNLSVADCVKAVELTGKPLEAVEYELSRGEDSRQEVIDAVEAWHAAQGQPVEVEASEVDADAVVSL